MVDELKLGSDLTGDVPVTHMLLAILNQPSSQKGTMRQSSQSAQGISQ